MPGKIQPERLGGDVCQSCWRGGNTVVATIGAAQRNARQCHCLARTDIPVAEGRAAVGHGHDVATDNPAQASSAAYCRRRAAVIDFVARRKAGQRNAQRVDGAGGVAGIAHGIVAAAVAVIHCHTRHRHRFVARAGRLAGKGKAAAGERVTRKQRTAAYRRRAAGRGAAIVGFGYVAGGQRQAGGRDVSGVTAAGEGVVAGQSACAIAQSQRAQGDCLAGANIFVDHRAGAGQGQCFAAHHIAQREDAGSHIRRAVVTARAGQIDGALADRAGGVAGVTHRVVAAAVAIVQRHARNRYRLGACSRIGTDKGKCAARQRVAGEQRARRNRSRRTRRRGVAVIGLADITG